MTACHATGTPIVGEVCWVTVPDSPPLPMCVAHFQADDCGRHLLEEFNGNSDVVTVLDRLMKIPCPGPAFTETDGPALNDDAKEALDRIWLKAERPSWELHVEPED
jgi:hypothetical protein